MGNIRFIQNRLRTNKQAYALGTFILCCLFFYVVIEVTIAAHAPSVVSVLRPTYSMSTEVVGPSNAHILVLSNPEGAPDYKWLFVNGGISLMINRKQGSGWVQVIAEIQPQPQYMKQQGQNGSFIWNPYGLNATTTGTNVLQTWDKLPQPDGSIHMVRISDTAEEGIAEVFTETWVIPAEYIPGESPKATYEMTKNRGLVEKKGVIEGTWRLKWALSGIAEITSDNANIVDENGWPIRRKGYSNGEYAIDVDDFDTLEATSTPLHTYSEVGANNKAEIIFFPDGTIGDRVVDPTVVGAGVSTGWDVDDAGRHVFFNGSYFFLLFIDPTDGVSNGSIHYKYSADNTTWSATSTLVSDVTVDTTNNKEDDFDVYVINDTKFDLAYISDDGASNGYAVAARTCTISSSTITCGNKSYYDTGSVDIGSPSVMRNPHTNRVWLGTTGSNIGEVITANQTGDITTSTTWSEHNALIRPVQHLTVVPFYNVDQALYVSFDDNGGTKNDRVQVAECTTASCPETRFIKGDAVLPQHFSGAVRISDSLFKLLIVENASGATPAVQEYDQDGNIIATLDSSGAYAYPRLFHDRVTGDLHAIWVSTADNPDTLYYQKKPFGGSWGSKTAIDDGESGDRSSPIMQLHDPHATTTTRDQIQLTYGYRVANGSNYDLKVGNIKLHDLSWATGVADFEIYATSTLAWDNGGTPVCSGTLTDDNTATTTCDMTISPSTDYRVQVVLKNTGESDTSIRFNSTDFIEHKNVAGGWAGSSPTIGGCIFHDFDNDNITGIEPVACGIEYSGGTNFRLKQLSTGAEVILSGSGTTGAEGFAYLITTDSDAPSSDDTSYFEANVKDMLFEDSSKINIGSSGPVYSVSITSDGVIEYGFVELGNATSTVGNGYTQTAQNDGSVTEKLNIKSSNATGGTTWTLAGSIGADQFIHEFSTTTGSTWATMSTVDTYVTADPSVAQSGTVDFDFRLTAPNSSSDYVQKSITITIQAVAP